MSRVDRKERKINEIKSGLRIIKDNIALINELIEGDEYFPSYNNPIKGIGYIYSPLKDSYYFKRDIEHVWRKIEDQEHACSQKIADLYNSLSVDDEVASRLRKKEIHSKIIAKLEDNLLIKIKRENEDKEKIFKSIHEDKEEWNESAEEYKNKLNQALKHQNSRLNKLGVNTAPVNQYSF